MNSPTPPSPHPVETAAVPAALEWRVHLARRQPVRALAAAACILLAGLGALLLFQSLLSALLSAGLLFTATSEFLLPMTYRLTADAAEARGPLTWRRIRWGDVKRVYASPGEVKLSPLAHGGPREAFRGVLLRCDENQAAVVALAEEFRRAAARS
jgi:hypothetical protein